MTFSFNLVLGLFLLAPGLAIFAGVYHGGEQGPIRSPPPPPGSILALAIVTVGALIAHFVGAAVFLIQDVYCAQGGSCLRVSYDPNAYATLFNVALLRQPVTGLEAFSLLFTIIALTAASFFITRRIAAAPATATALRGVLYGWLADVVVASGADEAVLAYVLSDVQDDGTLVGYEGVVANMTTNADKEVTSVLLSSCETFYLRVTASGVLRRKAIRTSRIPQLYLDRSRIKNIAFERVRFKP